MAQRKRSGKPSRPAPARKPAPRATGRTARPKAGTTRRTAASHPARPAPIRGVTTAPGGQSIPTGIGLLVQSADFDSHAIADLRHFYTGVLGFTDFVEEDDGGALMVRTGFGAFLTFRPPEPGPPEAWRPPREPAITFHVHDVDRAHRDLEARGAAFDQAPVDLPDGRRIATLRDPEGRIVMLVRPRRAN